MLLAVLQTAVLSVGVDVVVDDTYPVGAYAIEV